MFSRSRPIVDLSDQSSTTEDGPGAEDPIGAPCPVRVVTRGLAFLLIMGLVIVNYLMQTPPRMPAAFAVCDQFRGCFKVMAFRAADGLLHGCTAEGKLAAWNPRLSRGWIGGSQGVELDWAALTADGTTLAVADVDGVVTLWDVGNWQRRVDIPPRATRAKALVFSRDSATLAAADGLGVRLWDVTTAMPSALSQLDLPGVSSLAFDVERRRLAIGTGDGTVRFWDVVQGSQSASFQTHPKFVSSLAFSHDGRRLLTSSKFDKVARLWDITNGRLLREFDARSQIQAISFAPGDRELATAGLDGAVRLWNVATGATRSIFSERDGPVTTLAYSAEGETLACGGIGVIRLYRLHEGVQTPLR